MCTFNTHIDCLQIDLLLLVQEKVDRFVYGFHRRKDRLETIYVCTKGSRWSRRNENLVLRCDSGTWTAVHSALNANGSTLHCRQPVFRCLATNITQPGWHNWETNYDADPKDAGLLVDWQGELWAQTRVP